MPFRFKQFIVEDSNCPMKVGTDSVLLGAWARLENCSRILDIGTGCGLLALMAAQRSEAQITGIDIDLSAIGAAAENFVSSPWSGRLTALQTSLQDYAMDDTLHSFDHIISNPPYFINSLKAPELQRSNARHTDLLPFELLASAPAKLLSPDGRLSLVLPVNESEIFTGIAEQNGLHLAGMLQIFPRQGKPANRVLMEFGRIKKTIILTSGLVIRDVSGEYTSDYKALTKDFYLNF